jgi:hypothetical protein
VRRARESDLPSCMAMFEELNVLQAPWRVFPPRPEMPSEMRRRYEAAVDDPDAALMVAEEDGRVVGMAAGHLHRASSF